MILSAMFPRLYKSSNLSFFHQYIIQKYKCNADEGWRHAHASTARTALSAFFQASCETKESCQLI